MAVRIFYCRGQVSRQQVVLDISDGFEPLGRGLLAGNGECEVCEPRVLCSSVPVLYIGGNVNYRAREYLDGGLALFLIPASAGNSDKHLAASALGAVDVPIIAAAGLEGDIGKWNLRIADGSKVAVADEILGISGVGIANGEDHLLLELFLGRRGGGLVLPHLGGKAESSPGLGPAGVECYVGDGFGDFGAGDAVVLGVLQMVNERRVGNTLCDKAGNGDERTVAERQKVIAAPDFAEEYIVVEMGELGREIAESVAAGCLDDLYGTAGNRICILLCH